MSNESFKLIENYVLDLKKKEINPIERARLIKTFLAKKQLSQREFGKRYGIPHSIVQDWIQYDNINEDDYEKLKKNGLNEKEIYKLLRSNRTVEKREFINTTDLDCALTEVEKILNKFLADRTPKTSMETITKINIIKDKLNRIEMHIEMQNKGRI